MSNYNIIEVEGKKDLKRFIKFPDELYKDCKQYVPALHSDQMFSLTKDPALDYCKHKLWMVLDGNKVVGRICAMINPRYNELYGKKRARFGWFDTINDIDVAKLLIGKAEAWAKENGMTEVHGPLYYNTLGKQGMLVEGFENIPPFNCLYNFPYYNDLVTALGYEKECDWLQYKMDASQGVQEKVSRIAGMLKERYNLHDGCINKLKKNKEATAKIYQQYRDSTGVKDSAKVEAAVRKIIKDKAHAKYVRDHKQIWNKNTGKPIAKGEFMNWTDKTTSRSQTLVENFFGESIMLHQQNLLGDVLRNRPVIVKYQSAVNYVVEACIVVLFLLGILAGRKSKFLWLTLTFFLMDAALHIGLGFGINEVYIMTAHYMYALPIAIAFLALKAKGKNLKWAFRGLMLAITLYLWISNGYLLVDYMLG